MFPKVLSALNVSSKAINTAFIRNIGSTAILLNKTDPIQQLFLDKSREYYKKKASSKTGLLDSSAETQKALKDEVEKINKQFGSSSSAEFPTFKFSELFYDSAEEAGVNMDK